jgi:hypothetical protein
MPSGIYDWRVFVSTKRSIRLEQNETCEPLICNINVFKNAFNFSDLIYIYKFSSYLKDNTEHVHKKTNRIYAYISSVTR